MNAFTRQEITAVHLTRTRNEAVSEVGLILPGKTAYLPIVDARSSRILGYQATVDPGLGSFDCTRMQIAKSPAQGLLLMDMSAADCLKGGPCGAGRFCDLFAREAWTERELVIHVRCKGQGSVCEVARMQQRLQSAGIGVAVSWEGCVSLHALDALIDARVIRFEATILEPDRQLASSHAMDQVLRVAKRLGIQTMLAEVSDGEQIEQARRLGFDWLQGPLFNRLKVCN